MTSTVNVSKHLPNILLVRKELIYKPFVSMLKCYTSAEYGIVIGNKQDCCDSAKLGGEPLPIGSSQDVSHVPPFKFL